MFSEYASRFLAQSQSRISNFGQADNDERSSRPSWQGRGTRLAGRPYIGRGGGPYNPSGSRFGSLAGFGSRYAQDAPLFQPTLDHDEEDEEERDREAADLYALQRSRRVFAAGRLDESTETENDGSRASIEQSNEYEGTLGERLRGIRSSWNGTKSYSRKTLQEEPPNTSKGHQRQASQESTDTKGMEDVGLESTMAESEPPADLTTEMPRDSSPAPFQTFRSPAGPSRPLLRRDSTNDSELGLNRPPSTVATDMDAVAVQPQAEGEMFKHDTFFAWIYLIALASLFATFVLVFLHTEGKHPSGDTIYNTLRASFHLLAVDTLVSIVVSMVWLVALRSFVKPLVALVLVAVPVILVSFSLYPFISSYDTGTGSTRLQDTVMRWAATIPGVSAVLWVYMVYRGRHALKSAIGILEFSSRILAANSALILVGMGCLSVVVLWTWVWLLMFTRVFLGGSFSDKLTRFIISASTWWLGTWFILMYIWTLSVISAVQRSTTAATVSQWYFHRNVVPAPSSRDIVSAALGHAVTTIFGTISLSTLLALGIRLPLLVLPSRLANIVTMFIYSFIPTPIAALTNPLTLTYAAIHSQPLAQSARGLTQMDFLAPQRPTTTLTPAALPKHNQYAPLLPYRLSKLVLHATRFIMAIALGFAGWVMTAHQLKLDGGGGLRGSAYAYVVGLVASFIGWGILGAMEGILSGILDAVIVCYGSEKRMLTGAGGYCMEAAYLFGDRGDVRSGRDRNDFY
ncbi:choline transporter-like protein ctl1 [Podospora fimiseda]|uniref:Protein PNS1 n=1 Tax=Podospora fimiseda TaxID=252190 RepID=A0AAN7BT17_9PEZI|nr:choline transporter-like protein ctl1 [Podospora fimiseda]